MTPLFIMQENRKYTTVYKNSQPKYTGGLDEHQKERERKHSAF